MPITLDPKDLEQRRRMMESERRIGKIFARLKTKLTRPQRRKPEFRGPSKRPISQPASQAHFFVDMASYARNNPGGFAVQAATVVAFGWGSFYAPVCFLALSSGLAAKAIWALRKDWQQAGAQSKSTKRAMPLSLIAGSCGIAAISTASDIILPHFYPTDMNAMFDVVADMACSQSLQGVAAQLNGKPDAKGIRVEESISYAGDSSLLAWRWSHPYKVLCESEVDDALTRYDTQSGRNEISGRNDIYFTLTNEASWTDTRIKDLGHGLQFDRPTQYVLRRGENGKLSPPEGYRNPTIVFPDLPAPNNG
jgi:hypothetical protein